MCNELIAKICHKLLAISNAPTPGKVPMTTKTVATAKVDDIIRVVIDFILIGVMARASLIEKSRAKRKFRY